MATRSWKACTYLGELLAGFGLESCICTFRDLKSKLTAHQCSVPLGLNGKTRRSRSLRGIALMAARFKTLSRSCGPYGVGKSLSVIIDDTTCILTSSFDAVMCSHKRARYVSMMLVSRYCSLDEAGQAKRDSVRRERRKPRSERTQSFGQPLFSVLRMDCWSGRPTFHAGCNGVGGRVNLCMLA